MNITYCFKWWLKKKRPIDILDNNHAREKHLKGEYYTAVISENDKVNYVVSIDQNYVVVKFMNDSTAPYLTYEFHRVKDDSVFLKFASFCQYDGEQEIEEMNFNFEQDGTVYMEKINLVSGEVDAREGKEDVSCNWDKFPKFAEYGNLLRLERE